MKTVTFHHTLDIMNDEHVLEVLNDAREVVHSIGQDDFAPLETAGLNPYKYTDLLAYVLHLHPVELKGYNPEDFIVEWDEVNIDELQREWTIALEEYNDKHPMQEEATGDKSKEVIGYLFAENQKLTDWKMSSINVSAKFYAFMQSREDITAGTSIHAQAIAFIKERDANLESVARAKSILVQLHARVAMRNIDASEIQEELERITVALVMSKYEA